MDPNQTDDQQVQDQTGVTTPTGDQPAQAPAMPEPAVPAEPVATPEAVSTPEATSAEPVATLTPEATPIESGQTTDNSGNMDGDTTPPIPGV